MGVWKKDWCKKCKHNPPTKGVTNECIGCVVETIRSKMPLHTAPFKFKEDDNQPECGRD